MIYKDLRGFIKQVDELGALRRVNGADQKYELGGITEVAAGTPECPALLFDRIKGLARGLSRLHQRHHHAAARGAGARHRSRAQAARRAQGLDAAAADLEAAQARRGEERRVHGEFVHRQEGRHGPPAGAALAPQGRRAVHRLRLAGHHARSGRRLDQRLDLPRAGARQEPRHHPVRPSRPPRRDDREEILGQGQVVPGRGGERPGPCPVHRRLRISARRPVGVRLRRRDQGRADRGDARPA